MKRITVIVICCALLCITKKLYAQSWNIGGNPNTGIPTAGGQFGSNGNRRIIFETNGIERATMMNTSGFWGFNTKVPNARVHINSAAGEDALRVQVNGATKLFVDDAGGVSVGSGLIAPANGLFVSGNVGIGTTAPEGNLHIFRASAGTISANGNSPLVIENNTSAHISLLTPPANESGILFGNPTNNAEGAIIYNPGGNHGMLFITNGADAMTLGSNGSLFFNIAGRGVFFKNGGGLQDGDFDQIQTNRDFVPVVDGSASLGQDGRRWFDVWATDVTINSSDARLKKNIEDIPYGLEEILKLHPVSYKWIKNPDGQDGPKRLGMLAQEVQRVIPEVVRDYCYKGDEKTGKTIKMPTTTLGLQYDAIIPVLIKGMQEQQKIIATLEERISKLESTLTASNTKISGGIDAASVVLEQNQPNPFNQATIIRYKIPSGANAWFNVYDASGAVIKTMRASESGQVQINAGELKAGTYNYALFVDCKQLASKKMVILK